VNGPPQNFAIKARKRFLPPEMSGSDQDAPRRVVLLTQPQPRVQSIASRLAHLGLEPLVVAFSSLETEPFASAVENARSWIRQSMARSPDAPVPWDLVIFVSPGAVAAFQGQAGLVDWPDAISVATVGPGTLEALETAGLASSVRRIAPTRAPWDASALLASMREEGVKPRRVLVVCGATSRTDWSSELQSLGAALDVLTAYQSQPCAPDPAAIDRWQSLCAREHAWVGVVTQTQTAEALNRVAQPWHPREQQWMHAQAFLTIHPRIQQSLHQAGFGAVRLIPPGTLALDAALSSDLWSNLPHFISPI